MNDPNGLVFYRGRFHAFFQHYPHAQAFVAIDQPVSQEIIDELSKAEGVLKVSLLELG